MERAGRPYRTVSRSQLQQIINQAEPLWQLFERWHGGLAQIQAESTQPSFAKRLMVLLGELIHADEPLSLTVLGAGAEPFMLYEFTPEAHVQAKFEAYLANYFYLDPCYRAHLDRAYCGFYDFAKLAPQGYFDSEIFLNFFKRSFSDEIGLVFPFGEHGFANLCAAKVDGTLFSEREKRFLGGAAPVVIELLQRHLASRTPRPVDSNERHQQKIERILQNFGCEILSTKEHEVMQLLLRGYSMKAMAEHLNRSLDTIKKHHRSIYDKLSISSQREVLPLVIGVLENAEQYTTGDSLALYLSSQALPSAPVKPCRRVGIEW